jgi:hypothetical protein
VLGQRAVPAALLKPEQQLRDDQVRQAAEAHLGSLGDRGLGCQPVTGVQAGIVPAGVEFRDGAVARGIVVTGVEDRLAGQGLAGDRSDGANRDRHDDPVPGGCRLRGSGRTGPRPQFADEVGESLRRPRVAEHDVQAGADRQPGERAANVSAADESKCGHAWYSLSVEGRSGASASSIPEAALVRSAVTDEIRSDW